MFADSLGRAWAFSVTPLGQLLLVLTVGKAVAFYALPDRSGGMNDLSVSSVPFVVLTEVAGVAPNGNLFCKDSAGGSWSLSAMQGRFMLQKVPEAPTTLVAVVN
jgi:hypothetical protein